MGGVPSAHSGVVRYLTHPEVMIDPDLPVPEWSLHERGAARVRDLARRLGRLAGTKHVFSSMEAKAVQTATPLAASLGRAVQRISALGENDRSSTGYLPKDEFEAVAERFFAEPDVSVRGWETAQAAQERIVGEVRRCLAGIGDGDVLFVGHGAVGTLLFCALTGQAIDRRHDQAAGGGNWFEFSRPLQAPLRGWQPMELL